MGHFCSIFALIRKQLFFYRIQLHTLLRFFDYIFYRVCKAYSRTKDSSPEGAAISIVSVMQCLNIFSIFMLIEILRKDKIFISTFFVVIFVTAFMVLNYIRYIYKNTNNYNIMVEIWKNETKKFQKGILVVIYIVVSFLLTLGLAIYSGNKK